MKTLPFTVSRWEDDVRVDFADNVAWIAVPSGTAREFARALLNVAREIEMSVVPKKKEEAAGYPPDSEIEGLSPYGKGWKG